MPHEIIPSANLRLGGSFNASDHDGDGLDVGLAYGKTERDLFLLVSGCANVEREHAMTDVLLAMPDARALRDFLNGLDLSDPPVCK